jgi:HSP20 family protein
MAQRTGDPLSELTTVQQRMNKLFESAMGMADFDTQEEPASWPLACDVIESSDAIEICLEIPGVSQDQIGLQIEGDELIVSGARRMEREGDDEQFHRVERPCGEFSRRFRLPSIVDRDSIDASFREGVLRVRLTNRQGAGPESIQIAIR